MCVLGGRYASISLLLCPNPGRGGFPELSPKYLVLWSQWMLQMPAE